jgi:hypothetical protein
MEIARLVLIYNENFTLFLTVRSRVTTVLNYKVLSYNVFHADSESFTAAANSSQMFDKNVTRELTVQTT